MEAIARSRRHGIALVGGALGLLTILTVLVVTEFGPLMRVDESFNRGIVEGRQGWLDPIMNFITELGGRAVIGSFLLVLTFWMLRTARCRHVLIVLWVAFAVNPALEATLKWLVGRDRPNLLQLRNGSGPSFPSGHVLATVGFFGVLAVVAWKSALSRRVRITVFGVSTAMILGVGFSRMYLGVHWFTDVIGGFLIGTVYVVVVGQALRDHHAGRHHACSRSGAPRDSESTPSSLSR